MLDDEQLQLVRQGWLWKGGKTFGQYTQKRRHFLLVRAYGKAMLLHSADGVDVDASALAGELRRRKRIDLLDDCDVHPWDPRPGFLLTTRRRSYELDAPDRLRRDAWVCDVLSVVASAMAQSSRPETMLRRANDRATAAPPALQPRGVDWRTD